MTEIWEDGSVGLVETRTARLFTDEHPLVLANGSRLGPVDVAYETYGTLAPDASNVVYLCHALTGDAHAAGWHAGDRRPGWWDNLIGPGRPLDTDKFFVVSANILGGCRGTTGPGSIDPATGEAYGLDFPLLDVADLVTVHRALLAHLGLRRVLAVLGGSLGGMQALAWSYLYPERVAHCVALATAARHSAQAIAFNEVARQAIMADPAWQGGDYYGSPGPAHGLAVARMIGHVTYLSDEAMREKFGRRLHRSALSFDLTGDFQVESYLHHQGRKFVDRFDANSLLYITKAADYFDLQRGDGCLLINEALAEVSFLVISFTSDWLYPTYQSREIVSALKKNGGDVSFCEIEAQWGHDAFLVPNKRLDGLISGFLDRVSHDCRR